MEKKRLLIVDDTVVNLKLLGNLLADEYSLSFASGGQEALDILEKTLPDLVLLDIMMPEVDGFEVCRQIRSSPRTEDLPVILVTAKNDKESVVKGYHLGVLDYLVKPFEPEEVQSRVRAILEKIERKKSLAASKEMKQEQTLPMILERIRELEGRLDGAVRIIPELVLYLKDLEELLNTEEVLKLKKIKSDLDAIYDERANPELTAAVHTLSENMQDMQFDLLDVIKDMEELKDK